MYSTEMQLTLPIRVKDTCNNGLSYAEGTKLYDILHPILSDEGVIILDFMGIDALASGFLNASFGRLADERGGVGALRGRFQFTGLRASGKHILQHYLQSLSEPERT